MILPGVSRKARENYTEICFVIFIWYGIHFSVATRSGGGTNSNPMSSSSTMSAIGTAANINTSSGLNVISGASNDPPSLSATNNEESKVNHVRRRRKVRFHLDHDSLTNARCLLI